MQVLCLGRGLGRREGEGSGIQKDSTERGRGGEGCASAESCKVSRSPSHGQRSQAREQDVHKHGGVRKQGMFRNGKYFSTAAEDVPGVGVASKRLEIIFVQVSRCLIMSHPAMIE